MIVYIVLETARANGINPEKYLGHLLFVLPERFAENPGAPVDDMMPWSKGIREGYIMPG